MAGMPSARGVEFKGVSAMKRYQEAFDKLPRNPDGTLVYEPTPAASELEPARPPKACNECGFVSECESGCANGSDDCRRKLGL